MDNQNEKYNELVSRIKSEGLLLDDSQAMISEIMNCIEEMPDKQKRNRSFSLFYWVSNVAAVLVLGLFVLETSTSIPKQTCEKSVSEHIPYSLVETNVREDVTSGEINDLLKERRERQKMIQSFYMGIVDLD